jgi:hypothetical protein
MGKNARRRKGAKETTFYTPNFGPAAKLALLAHALGDAEVLFVLGRTPDGQTRIVLDPETDPNEIMVRFADFMQEYTTTVEDPTPEPPAGPVN